jgi:hypothetical protein
MSEAIWPDERIELANWWEVADNPIWDIPVALPPDEDEDEAGSPDD